MRSRFLGLRFLLLVVPFLSSFKDLRELGCKARHKGKPQWGPPQGRCSPFPIGVARGTFLQIAATGVIRSRPRGLNVLCFQEIGPSIVAHQLLLYQRSEVCSIHSAPRLAGPLRQD